jgi:hypothetical protein
VHKNSLEQLKAEQGRAKAEQGKAVSLHPTVLNCLELSKTVLMANALGLPARCAAQRCRSQATLRKVTGEPRPENSSSFWGVANGSLYELQTQLIIARGLSYATVEKLDLCDGLALEVYKMLAAFIPGVKSPKPK